MTADRDPGAAAAREVAAMDEQVHAGRFALFVSDPDLAAVMECLGEAAFDEWWEQLGKVVHTYARARRLQRAAEVAEREGLKA